MESSDLSRGQLCAADEFPLDSTVDESNGSIKIQDGNPFIPFDPALAKELKEKKPKRCSVSGTLLSIVYKRLSFWSRYAKHKHNAKRYFWKSQSELSEEIGCSIKQINRALKVLEELGLLIRQKLQKRFYRQVYFYYLPQSVHTKNSETLGNRGQAPRPSTDPTSGGTANSIKTRGLQGSLDASEKEGIESSRKDKPTRSGVGGGSRGLGKPLVLSKRIDSGHGFGKNVPIKTKEEHPHLKHTLKQIVEKCEMYGKIGINRDENLEMA